MRALQVIYLSLVCLIVLTQKLPALLNHVNSGWTQPLTIGGHNLIP